MWGALSSPSSEQHSLWGQMHLGRVSWVTARHEAQLCSSCTLGLPLSQPGVPCTPGLGRVSPVSSAPPGLGRVSLVSSAPPGG